MARNKQKSKLDLELEKIESEIDMYKHHVERPPKNIAPVAPKVVSAGDVEKEVRVIEKSLLKDKGMTLFYLVTSLVCVAFMAFLFGSRESFVFYFVFGLFLWWWAHQFHRAGSGMLKAFLSLGFMVILLYVAHVVFNEMLSLVFTVLYSLSFVIAGVLYFYHVRRELYEEVHRSFPHTFLVVLYSHIIAFTAGSAVAFFLPELLLSDSFVSIIYLLLLWVFPTLLVYFFLTKFLYLSFFDRKHILRDALRGFAHGLVYSVVFIALLVLAYLMTAIQFAGMESASYEGTFNDIFTTLQNAKAEVQGSPFRYDSTELLSMRVSQDIMSLSDSLVQDATVLRSRVRKEAFSFGDYTSDNYFTVLSRNRFEVARASVVADEVGETSSDLMREYERMRAESAAGSFEDGTHSMESHYYALSDYVAGAHTAYVEPFEFGLVRERMSNPQSYSGMLGDGRLVELALLYHPDMALVEPGSSRFSRKVYDVVYHTRVFRDLVMMVSDTVIFQVEETLNPYSLVALRNPAPDETLGSKVLRFRVLKSDIDATLSVAGMQG